jgi:hypothetical protein
VIEGAFFDVIDADEAGIVPGVCIQLPGCIPSGASHSPLIGREDTLEGAEVALDFIFRKSVVEVSFSYGGDIFSSAPGDSGGRKQT